MCRARLFVAPRVSRVFRITCDAKETRRVEGRGVWSVTKTVMKTERQSRTNIYRWWYSKFAAGCRDVYCINQPRVHINAKSKREKELTSWWTLIQSQGGRIKKETKREERNQSKLRAQIMNWEIMWRKMYINCKGKLQTLGEEMAGNRELKMFVTLRIQEC